ncbi:MAG: hypothetical protein ACI8ZM_003593 [Crocinitomix sp.]|jgi:hypothetical protein
MTEIFYRLLSKNGSLYQREKDERLILVFDLMKKSMATEKDKILIKVQSFSIQ